MSQMVTTCANCRQQLAVTAADLRVGQGYVRCGRCDKVFNALLTLAEDEPVPTEPESVAHGTRSVPALEEDDPLPPIPGRDEAPFEDEEVEVEVVQTHATGQFRSIVLEGEAGEARDDGMEDADEIDARTDADADADADADEPDPQRDQVARQIIRQATSQPIDVLLEDTDDTLAAARTSGAVSTAYEPSAEFDADEAIGNRRRASPLWYLAAVLLALALLAQYAHHRRHELVTVPWLAQPLQGAYGLFGMTVEPPWDLGQYEVQQLGAAQNPGEGTLTLQAAVAVGRDAPWAQPPPVLRVVLSDRWGNVLQTTDVPPQDWMLGGAPARLTPGQRVDARLALPAPERVSGFALSACLPDDAGGLRCRDDAR